MASSCRAGEGATNKPQVLAACPPFAFPTLERVLGPYLDLVFVNTLLLAQEALKNNPRLELIICGVHFDESRMYELLDHARREHPRVQFVCVRVLDHESSRLSRESIRIALESLGARLIDYATEARERGADLADDRLRAAVLGRLQPPQARGM
ncbi:MAG TPA: hypothetical protein VIV54_03455 [Burkholderiales bacterium]